MGLLDILRSHGWEATESDGRLIVKDGLEDSFDEGLTFVAERHSDPDLLWVYDKCAKRKECLAIRFEVCIF